MKWLKQNYLALHTLLIVRLWSPDNNNIIVLA